MEIIFSFPLLFFFSISLQPLHPNFIIHTFSRSLRDIWKLSFSFLVYYFSSRYLKSLQPNNIIYIHAHVHEK